MVTDPLTLLRPCIASMEGYVPGEQPVGDGFIKLNTNENPYPPSQQVLERIRGACGPDLRLYPDPSAHAVRTRLAHLFGVEREQTIVGNGSDELLSIILRAFVDPGQPVVYPTPTYSYYEQLVRIQGGCPHTVEFPADYSLPPSLAHEDARVVLLANPNSPSGTLIPTELVADLVSRSPAIVVLDEAYVDFSTGGGIELIRQFPNLIVIRTMSKSYSLAGMRIGFGFAARRIVEQLWKIKDHYNVNRLSLVAAEAALDDMDRMRANARRICRTREELTAGLRRLGFSVWDSQSNFVLARCTSPPAAELYAALKQRRILVRYFDVPRLRNCLRITVGTDQEVSRLLAALADLLAPRG